MSFCEVEKRPEPNLKEFTEEEMRTLRLKCYELEEAGYEEEAERLSDDYPLLPGVAQALKEQWGIDELIASGMNLSRAVKEYGSGWLER